MAAMAKYDKNSLRGGLLLDLIKFTTGKNLTDLEKQILDYVVENIETLQGVGVREVANETFTSPSSVIRLSKKLGYSGYTDMYYSLLPIVKRAEANRTTQTDSILASSFSQLMAQFSEEDLQLFHEKIFRKTNKYIFIYATGFSNIVAEYLYKKLLVLGRKVIFSTGSDSVGIFENNLDDIGAMLVVSKSGETTLVYEKLKKAVEAEIFTISFTQDTPNRIAELSDMNIPITDLHPLDDRNLLPNLFFPGVMVTFEFLLEKYLEQFG